MRVSRAIVLLVLALAIGAATARADPPPGEYTYDQAVALGIADPEDFARQNGEPDCPPLADPYPSVPEDAVIPSDAPSCYMPPDDQGLVFVVLGPEDPGFGLDMPDAQEHAAPDLWSTFMAALISAYGWTTTSVPSGATRIR